MAARLKEKYQKEIKGALQKELSLENTMAVPRLEKIVVNMGLGEATQNSKMLDPLIADLAAIAGQKPVTTRAKKSIAAFKVREGMPIGAMVTLRGDAMYEFLDRLIAIALPRVRDFRGVSTKSFDGRGNYTLGIRDQRIEHLRILRRFAESHVHDNLFQARHGHRVLEAQLLLERRLDFLVILLF